MPPGNIAQNSTLKEVFADVCCFCHKPGDSNIAGDLACLWATKLQVPAIVQDKGKANSTRTPLQFHEACAGYSATVCRAQINNHDIPDFQVRGEWTRSGKCSCDVCGEKGANLVCAAGAKCGKCFHFPCARIAAAGNADDRPTFSASKRLVACHEHRELISDPLCEPAGPWLEALGGWAHDNEEAKMDWARHGDTKWTAPSEPNPVQQQQQQRQHVEEAPEDPEQEDSPSSPTRAALEAALNEALDAAAAAIKGTSAPQAHPLPPIVPTEVPDIYADTFHIPGYQWLHTSDVDFSRLPPLRPGEKRLLSVTQSRPVAKACAEVMAKFEAKVEAGEKLQQVLPLLPLHDDSAFKPFTAKGKKKDPLKKVAESIEACILRQAQRCGMLPQTEKTIAGLKELPSELPVSSYIEVFDIPKNDPRKGLAKDPNAKGVRAKMDIAKSGIPPFTPLGIYGGLQVFYDDHNRLTLDHDMAEALDIGVTELRLRVDSYAADEDQLIFAPTTSEDQVGVFYDKPLPEAAFAKDIMRKKMQSNAWLTTSAYMYGNPLSVINDGWLDPLNTFTKGKEGQKAVHAANCVMISVLIRGWPFIALVACAKVLPGQEIVYNYGDGYWDNLRDGIDLHRALQQQEAKRREKQERELERKTEEIRQQLLLQHTGSGALPSNVIEGSLAAGLDSMDSGVRAPKTTSGIVDASGVLAAQASGVDAPASRGAALDNDNDDVDDGIERAGSDAGTAPVEAMPEEPPQPVRSNKQDGSNRGKGAPPGWVREKPENPASTSKSGETKTKVKVKVKEKEGGARAGPGTSAGLSSKSREAKDVVGKGGMKRERDGKEAKKGEKSSKGKDPRSPSKGRPSEAPTSSRPPSSSRHHHGTASDDRKVESHRSNVKRSRSRTRSPDWGRRPRSRSPRQHKHHRPASPYVRKKGPGTSSRRYHSPPRPRYPPSKSPPRHYNHNHHQQQQQHYQGKGDRDRGRAPYREEERHRHSHPPPYGFKMDPKPGPSQSHHHSDRSKPPPRSRSPGTSDRNNDRSSSGKVDKETDLKSTNPSFVVEKNSCRPADPRRKAPAPSDPRRGDTAELATADVENQYNMPAGAAGYTGYAGYYDYGYGYGSMTDPSDPAAAAYYQSYYQGQWMPSLPPSPSHAAHPDQDGMEISGDERKKGVSRQVTPDLKQHCADKGQGQDNGCSGWQ